MRRLLVVVFPLLGACNVDSVVAEGPAGAAGEGPRADSTADTGRGGAHTRSSDGTAGTDVDDADRAGSADDADKAGSADDASVTETVKAWCTEACAVTSRCPDTCSCEEDGCDCTTASAVKECEADCYDGFAEHFLGHGEACLTQALSILNCLDAVTCENIAAGTNPCDERYVAVASSDVCASEDDPLSTRAPVAGRPVVCQGYGATGQAPTAVDGGYVYPTECSWAGDSCSDHTYQVHCIAASPDESSCMCVTDGGEPRKVTLNTNVCPIIGETVFKQCGWPLSS